MLASKSIQSILGVFRPSQNKHLARAWGCDWPYACLEIKPIWSERSRPMQLITYLNIELFRVLNSQTSKFEATIDFRLSYFATHSSWHIFSNPLTIQCSIHNVPMKIPWWICTYILQVYVDILGGGLHPCNCVSSLICHFLQNNMIYSEDLLTPNHIHCIPKATIPSIPWIPKAPISVGSFKTIIIINSSNKLIRLNPKNLPVLTILPKPKLYRTPRSGRLPPSPGSSARLPPTSMLYNPARSTLPGLP